MSLTSSSAVVRQVNLTLDATGRHRATPAGLSAALRAYGRSPASLPARTVVHVDADRSLAPTGRHEGFAVACAPGAAAALAAAHRRLHDGGADFALVVTFPGTGSAATVRGLCRTAEAVAESTTVIGVLEDGDGVPRPLRHGTDAADPADDRLVLWSGQDEPAERRTRDELASLLAQLGPDAFPAVPAVLPCAGRPGPVRAAAVTTAEHAADAVRQASSVRAGHPRPVALLLPGQGSQHARMAAGLYGHEPVFTAAADAVLTLFGPEGDRIRADWLGRGAPAVPIDDVRRAQPLLFTVDWSLAKLVESWGVRPAALLGHSAGELVAAALAGTVSLSDAVAMVADRVGAAVDVPAGGMLAVAADPDRLSGYLDADVSVAACNANQQTMLAGTTGPLARAAERLRADGLIAVPVPATSPFHAPAMAPAARRIEAGYHRIPLRPPTVPFYSGYTGTVLGDEDAVSPAFWADQVTNPVDFRSALDELLAADDMLLLEAGPRQTLTTFARRHRAVRLGASVAVPLLPARPGRPEDDRRAVLAAAARLWTEGHDLDPAAVARMWNWTLGPAEPSGTAQSCDGSGVVDGSAAAADRPVRAGAVS